MNDSHRQSPEPPAGATPLSESQAFQGPGGHDRRTDDNRAFRATLDLLMARTGHRFGVHERSTLRSRVERRTAMGHVPDFDAYRHALDHDTAELGLLLKEIEVGPTSFFRDPRVFAHLLDQAIPDLVARRTSRDPLRVWIAGCSTGEEVYSLGMVLTEALHCLRPDAPPGFKIFATDIDGDVIDVARAGRYGPGILQQVSADRVSHFFVQEASGYRVRGDLREKVIFAVQDVAMDPPFTRLDLLVCRHLPTRFEPWLQRRLLPIFRDSLVLGGLLWVGPGGSNFASLDHFAPTAEPGLYRRRAPVGLHQ